MTLAENVNQIAYDWDPYGYRDSELSLEYFEKCLKECPEVIIEGLITQIEQMQEVIDEFRKGV